MINYKNEFKNCGFFKVENFIDKTLVKKIIDEINSVKNKNNVDIYYDQKGSLRRIERLYDKGEALKLVNQKITEVLKNIFNFDLTIFKDKYNAKPPGGEGFFAHYDGIFKFKSENNEYKNGWYEYGNFFLNVLVALDSCNSKNGTIEISNFQNQPFDKLFLNTKQNGTPDLLPEIEKKLKFKEIDLNVGDIVVFSNTCPHRSKKNKSNTDRKTLYYTYTPLKNGSMYEKYFQDKLRSKNEQSKSLSGEL